MGYLPRIHNPDLLTLSQKQIFTGSMINSAVCPTPDKQNGNGYRNFERFKLRVLYALNEDSAIKI